MKRDSKAKLRERIKNLEREVALGKEERALKVERIRLEERRLYENMLAERMHQVEIKAERLEAVNKEMEKRYDASSYKQLSDILKILVAKLPSIDIKEPHNTICGVKK